MCAAAILTGSRRSQSTTSPRPTAHAKKTRRRRDPWIPKQMSRAPTAWRMKMSRKRSGAHRSHTPERLWRERCHRSPVRCDRGAGIDHCGETPPTTWWRSLPGFRLHRGWHGYGCDHRSVVSCETSTDRFVTCKGLLLRAAIPVAMKSVDIESANQWFAAVHHLTLRTQR